MNRINIIGAGLAGCEAAYQLAKANFAVTLYEMRPTKMTPAHQDGQLAQLVCSNSLRSNVLTNAVGLLKEEMRLCDSLIMQAADASAIAAGSALAVDRHLFSQYIEAKLASFPNITLVREEIVELPADLSIVCSGPLTSDALFANLIAHFGEQELSFFDAIAPIVYYDSLDHNIIYKKNRYDKGDGHYLNCPMTKEEYDRFYEALINAPTVALKDFENSKVFEGCMPIEVMAKRGYKTMLFGPLKPVGLERDGKRPYAVVQLRQDNVASTLYNLVGFQTNLTYQAQKEVFSLIPGLKNATFARYGVMHRNSFINAPNCLLPTLQSKYNDNLFFAGQLMGVEGYVESAAMGLLTALYAIQKEKYGTIKLLTNETMMGALAYYVSHANARHFNPMNANFGLLATSSQDKELRSQQALAKMSEYVREIS